MTNKTAKNLIVSLTSYPKRITTLKFTLNTLFNQTIKPEKIILVLASNQFEYREKSLPKEVLKFIKFGLEIIWYDDDLKSHLKLIPALKKYPKKIIVTADDDVLYEKNWLQVLYLNYLKDKKSIHCHRCHLIRFDSNKNILPYNMWDHECKFEYKNYLCFCTGVGGVLYPPNSLYKDITEKKTIYEIMSICR